MSDFIVGHLANLLRMMMTLVQVHIEQCIYRLQRCKYCREEVPFINLQVKFIFVYILTFRLKWKNMLTANRYVMKLINSQCMCF